MAAHSVEVTSLPTGAQSQVDRSVRWAPSTCIAFRFFFVYFILYVLFTQMLASLILLPVSGVPPLGQLPPMRNITVWVASHVFGISRPLIITGSGSGDKTFDWVQAFCLVVIATLTILVWSFVDRARDNYVGPNKWFRLFLRFSLGSTMVTYGMFKAFPLQMPAPGLTRLLEPFGNFSPMGVLWYSLGAAKAYEIVIGCSELTGGGLLFVPSLATVGALVCLVDTIGIFVVNLTYDVPVKLFAFHLIVMALVLLAPEASRLANVIVLNRTAGPSTQPPLVSGRRAIRVAVAAQLLFGAYLIGMNFYADAQRWRGSGDRGPKSPLYGIWNVEEMSIDGHIRSPLITDYDRWRRVVFQTQTGVSFQRMDDTFANFAVKMDTESETFTLTKAADKSWAAQFTFERRAPQRLVLTGDMDGHKIRMQLQLFDRNAFLLVNRGFHWIQEYPFNR